MSYKDLRISRKEVLAEIRRQCVVDQFSSYSEPRDDHQRVKWYGCSTPIENIQEVLEAFNWEDVTVEKHIGNGYYKGVESVVLRFPYSDYK